MDESGDAGIRNVREQDGPGASPYMTLCAAFIPSNLASDFRLSVAEVRDELRKRSLHTSRLRHHEKVYLARKLSKLRMRLFAVASYKPTLEFYSNQIGFNSEKFYNKCVKYLLEKIGAFMIDKKISPERVYFQFEERNHDYGSMISYISKVRKHPIYPESLSLQPINPMSISFKKKKDEPLFIIPDFGANALYSCFNKSKSNHGIVETRYINELAPVFHRSSTTNRIANHGIKFIHSILDLNPDDEIKDFFECLNAR